MAEQVQSILERMVPSLKDLRDRGLFAPSEIHSIVERRRRSEYLLQRRGSARKSDYLRYIEDEVLLERLRKLRKGKLLAERRREEREKRSNNGENNHKRKRGGKYADGDELVHASSLSGMGDHHVVSHVHFLYHRALRKFHHPLDVLLSYAEFCRAEKSFAQLGRAYAEGLQRHPRESGLWIEAASFEYFGYVARDQENDGGEGEVTSKVAGSSIRNARVLMQRGLRVNRTSPELWLQYFALELHYVQKLRGRRELLGDDRSSDEEDDDGGSDREEDEAAELSMLPCRIIFKNAIKAIPDDVRFRLKFVEACRSFPRTEDLEGHVMESVTRDFGRSVEGWVARISYAEEEEQRRRDGGEDNVPAGFLAPAEGSDDDDDEGSADGSADEGGRRPAKKARAHAVVGPERTNEDPSLALLREALEALPTSRMYLEGSRFLRLRIQRLLDDEEEEGADQGAAGRHARILEELHEDAARGGISSVGLTLDNVEYLTSTGQWGRAEGALRDAVDAANAADPVDARIWLKWAEVSQRMMEERETPPSSSAVSILRRGLKRTPIHDRRAHAAILTELMRLLMTKRPPSSEGEAELRALFEKLVLISQGSDYFVPGSERSKLSDGDGDEEEMLEEANPASTFLAYLEYAALGDDGAKRDDAVRFVYAGVLQRSSYGESVAGKMDDEIHDMGAFFDACLRYESSRGDESKKKKERAAGRARLRTLCEAAIGFFASGGGRWRRAADVYRKQLDDLKFGL